MRLICLMPCRNEAWCVGPAIRAILRWCDAVVVHNHASTDRTGEILESLSREYPDRVKVLFDQDPVWREMKHRQALLDAGRAMGGDAFAIVDADEMLTENLVPRIRGVIESIGAGEVLQPPWICLWRSLSQFRNDASVWSNSWVSMAFRDRAGLHWQTRDGYDFHHRHPYASDVAPRLIEKGQGGLLHLQHTSWRRLLAKQALYKLTESVRWGGMPRFSLDDINNRYDPTVNEEGIRFADLPAEWIPPELADVDLNATPWQEAECRRLIEQHGRERFSGLDLFGVV